MPHHVIVIIKHLILVLKLNMQLLFLGYLLLCFVVFACQFITYHEFCPKLYWSTVVLGDGRMKIEDFCVTCCSKCYFLSSVSYLHVFYVLSELLALLISDKCFIELYHFLELIDLILQVTLKSVLKYLVFSLILRIVRLKLFKTQLSLDFRLLIFAGTPLWFRRLEFF